ncbi:D-alanyl-D-alanine carboxypeptidase [Streptomyces sp. B21-097]|uniref:D-alanyl-D-alanine carboxypeptidase n=1 Tax=Streptomyces sp. B21-097 TaxID=3039414 RepID=UPI002FEEF2C9
MAGESPDRSKQRESSAEPTSGSAGTVPEARESRDPREARDPRVAVAREGGSPAARAGGGVDTATRVFSVRDLKTEETDAAGEADGTGKPDEPEATDEPEAAEAAEAAEGQSPAARADGERANEEPTDAEAANADAGAVVDADDDSRDGGGPEAAEAPEDAESSPEEPQARDDAQDAPADAEEAESAPEIPDAAPEGGDERLRAAVAQWVSSADGKTGEKAEASSTETDADTDVDTDADAVMDAEERSASVAEAADRPASASASEPKAEARPASKPAPKWATDEKADEADKADKADKAEETGESDRSDEPGGTAAPADAVASGKTDASDKADAEPGDKADEPPVDQPTAVFKTPRPKPAVDQPTTMLKLGGATRPASDEDDKSGKRDTSDENGKDSKSDKGDKGVAAGEGGGKSTDEAPAERTSKFVALKPLDEPRAPKPAVTPSGPRQADVTALVPQVGPERTTQQPLPPKPPLDLLAELTNTPPPPPTPLRQLGRRLKIWTPLVLLLVVVFAIAQAVRPLPAPGLTLTAKDSYTFEGGRTQLPWPSEGQGWMDADGVGTMGSFGKQTPVAIGSVAKTMTAYIILRDHPMKAGEEGPQIEVDATAEKEGGYDVTLDESTLNTVKAGDKLTEKQALSAVIVPSANNIARLLARWDAGSEAAFVKKMNATAKQLGMANTTYTDPSGLKETTVSTAEDQVKLGRAFVKVPALVAISSVASWTDPSGKYWSNYNELPLRIGAIGIKTGSTSAAGGNLLFAARKKVGGKSVTLVGAVLGQHKREILKTANVVSEAALLAAEDALTSAKILKKGDVVGYVDDKLGGHTPVVITKDVPAVGWAGMTVKLSFAAAEVPHTAKAGAQVGTLTVGDGTSSAVKVPVALRSDLSEPGFSDKLTRLG